MDSQGHRAMKLYAKTTSERDSRTRNKGGNEFIQIELSAFNRIVGYVVLEITPDDDGAPARYRLKFAPSLNSPDWLILKEGGQKEIVNKA